MHWKCIAVTRVRNKSISCPVRDLCRARHREVFFITLRVQCGSSSWTILLHTGTRSCAEHPSLPQILEFCQLPCSNHILAPVVLCTGWLVIKILRVDRYGCRRINGYVHFPKFALRASWEIIVRSLMHTRGSCCVGPFLESFLIATNP